MSTFPVYVQSGTLDNYHAMMKIIIVEHPVYYYSRHTESIVYGDVHVLPQTNIGPRLCAK